MAVLIALEILQKAMVLLHCMVKAGLRGNDYTSTSSNWNLTGFDQAAMDAHFGVFINLYFFIRKYFIEIVMMETELH